MGNWIPNDPTLVAQILRISSAYSPPPPEGTISPMTWGVESHVVERFGGAGVSQDRISCVRDTYTFSYPGSPAEYVSEFRSYYGPTMNAFEAAGKSGRATELEKELVALFQAQEIHLLGGPQTALVIGIHQVCVTQQPPGLEDHVPDRGPRHPSPGCVTGRYDRSARIHAANLRAGCPSLYPAR